MIRIGIAAAAIVLLAAPGGPASVPMAEAPPPGFTGGFGQPTCLFCHLGSEANAFGGRVRIEGLPAAYEGGAEYVLTVDLAADETTVAGFQLTARFAEGRRGENAGWLQPLDDRTARTDSAGVTYLHQSRVGSAARDEKGSAWSFVWTAPRHAEPVVFHVAANSGNGDNSPLSDLVYTHEHVVESAR